MNAKFSTALVFAAAIAAPVFAQAAGKEGRTREEVRAEVFSARSAGELDVTEANFPKALAVPASLLPRAQVRAEVLRARAAGELDLTEVNFSQPLAEPASTLTRAQVRAEAIRARNAGEIIVDEAGTASVAQ